MSIQIDMRQMVLLIAGSIGLVGVDDVLHGRRVAILAVQCAARLGWDQAARSLLLDAGLLHDIGVSSTRVHRTLVNEMDWAESGLHCEKGSLLLKSSSRLAHLAPIVLHHHTHWDDLQQQGIDPDLALHANLIYLADRVDAIARPFYPDDSVLMHVEEISSRIERHRGTFFAPELVDAFIEAARAEAFWMVLDPQCIPGFLSEMELQTDEQRLSLDELKELAHVLAEIVDAKSHFTSEHSLSVANLTRYIAGHFDISGERLDYLHVAALMHDLGKLQIPDELLESTQHLVPLELVKMKRHSFATYQLLNGVTGMEELARWASQHHESLDGSGYPFRRSAEELSIESRIIKVADIYQALAQDRPYRKPLAAPEILSHLRQIQTESKVDPVLVDFVEQNLDSCHWAATGGRSLRGEHVIQY